MGSIVSREEIRRLEKAAREKDKKKLAEWIRLFEEQLSNMIRMDYERAYQDEIATTVENTLTAVAYTAYFSEENYVDKENIADYMSDLFATLDMYRTGEYTPKDYKDTLQEVGVCISDYDADKIYKKYLNIFDSDLVKYLKGKRRKIVTICGSSKFKDEILQASQDLSLLGYVTLLDTIFDQNNNSELQQEELKKQLKEIQTEKILMADVIYVVNKGGYIGEGTKLQIEYAKEHNKEIMYLESVE